MSRSTIARTGAGRLALIMLGAALAALIAEPVLAQDGGRGRGRGGWGWGGGGGFGAMLQPEFIRRDLRLMDERLSLDDDQSAIAENILAMFEAASEYGKYPIQ